MADLVPSVLLSGLWPALKEWFSGLGEQYGVNPLIFGSISVGAIPFFWLSVAWLVRNLRRGRSPFLPVLAVGSGLIVEVFGFGSGVYAYVRQKLIDYRIGGMLLSATVPAAIIGGVIATAPTLTS